MCPQLGVGGGRERERFRERDLYRTYESDKETKGNRVERERVEREDGEEREKGREDGMRVLEELGGGEAD